MEFISELNKVGDLQYKDFRSIKSLKINSEYKIEKFEKVKSNHRTQIICYLEEFKVNLPRRFLIKRTIKHLTKELQWAPS